MTKRRIPEFDMMRGFAILMVMLYHSIIVYPVNLHEIQWCSNLHTFLWVVQMPLFFFVSGYCYASPLGKSGKEIGNYLQKKVLRILIPHICFSLLDILPRIVPNSLVHEQMSAKEAVVDLVVYGGSDWFLWTFFLIAVLFPLFEWLVQGNLLSEMIAAVLIFSAKEYITDVLLLNMASQFLLYFTLGHVLRQKGDILLSDKAKWKKTWVLFPLMTGVIALFFLFLECDKNRYIELICVLCSLAFFYLLATKVTARRFFIACGTWSLQMYLLDAYALVFTRTLMIRFWHIEDPVLLILGNFILDTLIVLVISKYVLDRWKIFRLVSGIPEKR